LYSLLDSREKIKQQQQQQQQHNKKNKNKNIVGFLILPN